MAVDDEVRAALAAIVGGSTANDLESSALDFKTVGRSREDTMTTLAQAAACFANAWGGSVVVGIADKTGGPDAFVGCELDVSVTRRRIFELTDPHLTVDVERFSRPEGEVMVINVPESATLHSVKGRHNERIGTSCMPMAADRIARIMAERSGDDWSDGATETPVDAVDPIAVAIARRFLEQSIDPRRQGYAKLSDPDLLRALGLVTTDGRLNRAGALLLAPSADDRELASYSYRRTPSGALTANEWFTAPLVSALDRIFDLIGARVDRTSVDIGKGQQAQIEDLPEAAVREAVVNAVMHRDYRDKGRVVIDHAATRLAVTSPGPFISGVSASTVLTAASRSRNPRLAEAIRKLGLAETAGTGVDRMFASMARLGHQPPVFEEDAATVRVTLLGGAPNRYLTRFVATLPSDAADDADTMLVLLTLLTRRTVTAGQLTDVLQKPTAEVQAVLDRLAAPPLDLLEPTRESARWASPTYRLREQALTMLGPALSYRRRISDSTDRKVVALAKEVGTVNARMIRLLLDADATTSSRILADLVDRGLLVKTSKATRGPGVTYGPGPKLVGKGAKAKPERRGPTGDTTHQSNLFDNES